MAQALRGGLSVPGGQIVARPLWVRAGPVVAIGLLIGPVLFGLAAILGPAFGYAPLFGGTGVSLAPFVALFSRPGIWTSIWLGFWIGPAAGVFALAIASLFVAAWAGTKPFRVIHGVLRPVLAMPHAAAAFGLALLIAPSGFLVRLLSPWPSGFSRPPDWLIVNDPAGFTLLLGLVLKETSFLLLMLLAALPQTETGLAAIARTMGQGRIWAFFTGPFPALYAQIRLPVYAVIVFSGSVVDMAMILGPGTPPTLAVRIVHWMNDPDFSQRFVAAAAALTQFGLGLAGLAMWRLGEKIAGSLGRRLALSGTRLVKDRTCRWLALIAAAVTALIVLAGGLLLLLNAFAGPWRFPAAWPQRLGLATWQSQGPDLFRLALQSAAIALPATILSVLVALVALENEYRRARPLGGRILLFLPLLVPQIGFLPGLSFFLLRLGLDGAYPAVVFAHLVFVLPYAYLVLADPWHAFDTRLLDTARTLGKSPTRALFAIRLPLLSGAVATALALGFAISNAQYLPTLLIGAGRIDTLTTEAVALASGGNRSLIGAYAGTQTLLSYLPFWLAALAPALFWRQRPARGSETEQ